MLRAHWRRSPPLLHDYGRWRQRCWDGNVFSVGIIGDSLAFRGGAARILLLRPRPMGAGPAVPAVPAWLGEPAAPERLRPTPRALLKVLAEMEAIRVCLAQTAPARLPTLMRLREWLDRGETPPGERARADSARDAAHSAPLIGGRDTWADLDLSALAGDLIAQLRREHPDHKVETYVAPGLRAIGERRLIELLLRELLEHSWRQTLGVAAPGVRVDCVRSGDERIFYVRDNGPSFDAAEIRALFEGRTRISARAGRREAHIGLLAARHVAESHRGRLWVDGFAGVGATWYFTLPIDVAWSPTRASSRQGSPLRS